MPRFLTIRLVQSLLTLIGVSIIIFWLARLSGDPLQLMLPVEATPEQFAAARQKLGLDRPVIMQYVQYMAGLARGDLGTSIRQNRPVAEIIWERAPVSLALAVASIFVALAIGVPLGVVAAVHKGGTLDTVARVVALLGQSLPPFFVGIILILLFGVTLRILPVAGAGSIQSYVLPSLTIGTFIAAGIVRLLRSSMLDVLDSEYVKLAKLKGVAERTVIWKHALRNAILPVFTFAGLMLSVIVAAAIVVEQVFAWPGVGRLAFQALNTRDFPLLQSIVLLWTLFVLGVNLVVDILYAVIDPRIRY